MNCSIMPVTTLFGELSGAIGAQYGITATSAAKASKVRACLSPRKTDSIADSYFEELDLTPKRLRMQAAGRIEHNRRLRHR